MPTLETPPLALPLGMEIRGDLPPRASEVLTHEALAFVGDLVRRFRPRVEQLLERRREMQRRYDVGERPNFLSATEEIRAGDWTVAPLPPDLQDRRVEITGPVDRKMIINALNSGANVFMADFEDSNSPTWRNVAEGQVNLRDAVEGTIEYAAPDGRRYRLKDRTAVLMVRPRGWHLLEKHVLVDGKTATAALRPTEPARGSVGCVYMAPSAGQSDWSRRVVGPTRRVSVRRDSDRRRYRRSHP